MIPHVALLAGLLHAMCGEYLAAMYARRSQEDHTARFTGCRSTEHDKGEQAERVEQQLMKALQHHIHSLSLSLSFSHLQSLFVVCVSLSVSLSLSFALLAGLQFRGNMKLCNRSSPQSTLSALYSTIHDLPFTVYGVRCTVYGLVSGLSDF